MAVFGLGCSRGKGQGDPAPGDKRTVMAPDAKDCADPDPSPDTQDLLQQVNDFAGLIVVDPYEGAYLAFEGIDDLGAPCSVLWHSGSRPLCAGGDCPPSLDSELAIGASSRDVDLGLAPSLAYSPGAYGEGFAGSWPFKPVVEHWELARTDQELTLATRDQCQTRTVRATRADGVLTAIEWQQTQPGRPPEAHECHALKTREACPGTAPAAPTADTVNRVAATLGLDGDAAATLAGTTATGVACQVALGTFTYSDDQGTRVTLAADDQTSVSESYETRAQPGNHVGDDYVRNLTLTSSADQATVDLTTPEGYVVAGTFPRCRRSHLEAAVAGGAVTSVKLSEQIAYAWETPPFKATAMACGDLKR